MSGLSAAFAACLRNGAADGIAGRGCNRAVAGSGGGRCSAIVELLAADQLGATRDGADSEAELRPYLTAFAALQADPAHLLLVAADGEEVVATMQLSLVPGLARRGALRAQIEGGTRPPRPSRSRAGSRPVRVGDRRSAPATLCIGATHHRQVTRRRTPLLRTARVRTLTCGSQALPLTLSLSVVHTDRARRRSCRRSADSSRAGRGVACC